MGAEDGAGVPRLEDGAADEVFLARPSLLICSEMLMGILSPPGVTSRELDEGSFLIVAEAEAEAFFEVPAFGVEVAFGVEALGAGAVELAPYSPAAALAAFSFLSASILSARL